MISPSFPVPEVAVRAFYRWLSVSFMKFTVAERFSHQMKQNDRLVFAADQEIVASTGQLNSLFIDLFLLTYFFGSIYQKKCILAYILHFHIIIDMNVQKHKIESEINRIIPAKPHEIQLCAKISSSMED